MIKTPTNKNTGTLIVIMGVLVLLGIGTASVYYKRQNENVDPRIKAARTLYEKYNIYAQDNNFDSVFYLMDTIESIYNQHEHYRNSFEKGVLYNNRAAALLTKVVILDSANASFKDSILEVAEKNINTSIHIYQQWNSRFNSVNNKSISEIIHEEFLHDLECHDEKLKQRIISNRINEIKTALGETDRRLSVCYTNLGIIYRHKGQYEAAAASYKKAITLWDKNLTAENNLNKLLNRPLKKINIIQKLFPPDRKGD
ncbi:MAG: tetratricopeptide repeat protein [Bacteroidales bacterium]